MIFYIFACDKKINYALAQQKILNKHNINYYFVYGKGNNNKLSPYIEVDCDESYVNLPLKTFYSMKHFLTKKEDIYVKLDDDVFVDFNKLNKDVFENYNYGGWIVDHTTKQLTQEELLKIQKHHFYKIKNETENLIDKKPVIDIKYAEGAFYFIRKKLIEKIINTYSKEYFINSYSNFLDEDIRIGKIIHELKEPLLDLKYSNDLLLNITNNFLSIHPVHYFILDKLYNTPDSEKIKLLTKYNFLNDYIHRKDYLEKINKLV